MIATLTSTRFVFRQGDSWRQGFLGEASWVLQVEIGVEGKLCKSPTDRSGGTAEERQRPVTLDGKFNLSLSVSSISAFLLRLRIGWLGGRQVLTASGKAGTTSVVPHREELPSSMRQLFNILYCARLFSFVR